MPMLSLRGSMPSKTALTPDYCPVTRSSAFAARTYRVVSPRWAHAPLSGDGARLSGGRFNPAGVPAFYSALDPHTAYAEYTQGLFDRPGLLCTFDIARAHVVDLREPEELSRLDINPTDLLGAWLGPDVSTSQQVGTKLIDLGYDGALFTSLQHAAGSNFVMWHWNSGGRANIRLVDRLGEAPITPLG